jgi:ATP-binding protein involved in chromosome partitioning
VTFRTYHAVTGADASGVAVQVAAQRAQVRARLARVRRVVAVVSGKGGVGKSFVTAALARAAAARWPGGVGVVDADLASPTVARLLAATGPLRITAAGVQPAAGAGGVRVVSTDFVLEDGRPLVWREPAGDAFVWRGALAAGVLREFLADVAWGDLELLLVDLPPGADVAADLHALAPALAGLIVTMPTDEARRGVARAARAARAAGVRLVGVIENMAGYRCPDCAAVGPLFPGDAGAALAAALEVPLLARIPFAPRPEAALDAAAAGRILEALA